ncbi:hypothetical protein [Streptomyces acidicola]|uniref:hypothetical protein n=1 Tax=Streptomyces acidicola TaxID=2596892 RepID=UPI0034339000
MKTLTFTKTHFLMLVGGLLALVGGLPLAERAYAHIVRLSPGLGVYGPRLGQALLLALGVAVLAVVRRGQAR